MRGIAGSSIILAMLRGRENGGRIRRFKSNIEENSGAGGGGGIKVVQS